MSKQEYGREAIIVAGLGFGDEGKGTTIDYLARMKRAHTVVRYNGGAQAAHNVVAPDGRHHTFSQFGSATLVPGVRTHLSRHMIVEPLGMVVEARRLTECGVTDAFLRTTISEDALVITPFQRAANQIRELARGEGRHGSVGVGVGETVADSLKFQGHSVYVRDLRDPRVLRRKLQWMQDYKKEQLAREIDACHDFAVARGAIECLESTREIGNILELFGQFTRQAKIVTDSFLKDILQKPGCILFEGSQGVLLDEFRGFHPYTTWSTCTFENALNLLRAYDFDGSVTRFGVVRAYATRHGAGPFVTEDENLTSAIPDMHNKTHEWQGSFRIGWFDAVATRYAIAVSGGVDSLVMTNLDRLRHITEWRLCTGYTVPRILSEDNLLFARDKENDGRVIGLRVGPRHDLRHQEILTSHLFDAKPVYRLQSSSKDFAARILDFVSCVQDEVQAPISVISYGPTAEHKYSFV